MKVFLQDVWDKLKSTYWFLPALMALGSIGLSFLTVYLDERYVFEATAQSNFIWLGEPDGARQLLAVIAGSIITVAGVIFSVTIVAFSQVSSQFGPHLLRNFMRDRGNQFVLGTFVATFLYSLLILRTVRGSIESSFVPNISVTVALAMALASTAVLIYFVHHATVLIQAPVIVNKLSRELITVLNSMQDRAKRHGDAPGMPELLLPAALDDSGLRVTAEKSGYIQAIDDEALFNRAVDLDLVIRISHQPGHFIRKGEVISEIFHGDAAHDELIGEVRNHFFIGHERTHLQDEKLAIDQLAEVAVRSLSPGINDPFTAMNCIDALSEGLAVLAAQQMPATGRFDDEGHFRIHYQHQPDFDSMMQAAFDQIRQNSSFHVVVLNRLLESIEAIIGHCIRPADVKSLLHHADMVRRSGMAHISEPNDREAIERHYQDVIRAAADRSASIGIDESEKASAPVRS